MSRKFIAKRNSLSLLLLPTCPLQPENLPEDADPRGLEATEGYKTVVDSGTFSYAAHACTVAVDTETGAVDETPLVEEKPRISSSRGWS